MRRHGYFARRAMRPRPPRYRRRRHDRTRAHHARARTLLYDLRANFSRRFGAADLDEPNRRELRVPAHAGCADCGIPLWGTCICQTPEPPEDEQ